LFCEASASSARGAARRGVVAGGVPRGSHLARPCVFATLAHVIDAVLFLARIPGRRSAFLGVLAICHG
jgi:hypothetical protein